jgi:hypothetical protein
VLSEHTAAKSAMLFFMKGEASIKAKTPVVMLLVLLN